MSELYLKGLEFKKKKKDPILNANKAGLALRRNMTDLDDEEKGFKYSVIFSLLQKLYMFIPHSTGVY